jgi:hypothetical protein
VESEWSAPLSPLWATLQVGPLWATLQVGPLCPLWPQYRAVDHQDESNARQCDSHCLCCNTPGVYHRLGSGFELKHDRLSGNDDAKVKPMEINPNLKLDVAPLLYI